MRRGSTYIPCFHFKGENMETKKCSKCGKELPLSAFPWRNKSKGTYRADCKECHSNYMKQKYQ